MALIICPSVIRNASLSRVVYNSYDKQANNRLR